MPNSSDAHSVNVAAEDARAYNQQAITYALDGRLEDAVTCLEAVLRLQPDSAGVYNNLGNVRSLQERYEDAVAIYRQAVCLKPDFAEAYSNLGDALSSLGRYDDAVSSCQQAIRLRPNYAEAYSNLGNAYRGLGKPSEARACYEQALALNPDLPQTHNNLGIALFQLNKLDEALACYRAALRLRPDSAEAYFNLGKVFLMQGNWDDATEAFQSAAERQPNLAKAYANLGYVRCEQGKPEEAETLFEQALRLKPDDANAHWSRALSLLVLGKFEQGWQEYEWRWQLNGWSLDKFPQPVWDGSSLAGRTILLNGEQGFGDTIQFVRYATIVKQYGGTVILGCHKPLLPLLASCPGIDGLVTNGSSLPAYDVQAPLLSLPRILKTSLRTVPAKTPYLFPDAQLQKKWQRKVSRYPGFKIGIVWQGNPQHHNDKQRSIPLVHFAPLARTPGVCLISLQKGPGTEQLRAAADRFPVIDMGSRFRSSSFADAAAVVKNLDLVISVDSAIAHLAGALAIPIWVLLPHVPDWRWLLECEDSPWYPTMRLFRQTEPGDWKAVFDRVAHALSRRLRSPDDDRGSTWPR